VMETLLCISTLGGQIGCCEAGILACTIDVLTGAREGKRSGYTEMLCGVGMRDGNVDVARGGCEDEMAKRGTSRLTKAVHSSNVG
jgi:hypothetical protein